MEGILTGAPKLRGMIARRQGRARGFADRSFERAANNTLRSGLISWWPLDEATGTRYDRVGANHLTAFNNPVGTAGLNGPATQFVKASTQSLWIANNPSLQLQTADWEVNLWIKPTTLGFVVTKWNASSVREWVLQTATATQLQLLVYAANSGPSQNVAGPNLVLGEWSLLSFGRQGERIFCGTNLQLNFTVLTTVIPADATNDLVIGSLIRGTAGGLDAVIGSTGLWRRALSPAERAKIYNAGLGYSPL